jgi:hypothetical protein
VTSWTDTALSIWNFAAAHSLVIVTANVPHSPGQRVDIEILDGSERANVYLSKKVGFIRSCMLQGEKVLIYLRI